MVLYSYVCSPKIILFMSLFGVSIHLMVSNHDTQTKAVIFLAQNTKHLSGVFQFFL